MPIAQVIMSVVIANNLTLAKILLVMRMTVLIIKETKSRKLHYNKNHKALRRK